MDQVSVERTGEDQYRIHYCGQTMTLSAQKLGNLVEIIMQIAALGMDNAIQIGESILLCPTDPGGKPWK